MAIQSIDPTSGKPVADYQPFEEEQIRSRVARATSAHSAWARLSVAERARVLAQLSELLLEQQEELAGLMTREMGKLAREASDEIEKCAWVCRYYAEHADGFLAEREIPTDASRSALIRQPLGVVLAVMPWNFPFWQVFRCAIPALAAGNTMVLKHASNVTGCALAIEKLFAAANAPRDIFTTLVIGPEQAEQLIADEAIAAVSLTGSEGAGRAVAEAAGRALKKAVLELGGSDPFVVLEDANVAAAAEAAVKSRFLNCGQSCISAKRFLVASARTEEFSERFVEAARQLEPGDPADSRTGLAPMARGDLRDTLDRQVQSTLAAGGRLLTGGGSRAGAGFFYEPTVVDDVPPDSDMATQEVFGPAAAIMRFSDEFEAVQLANSSQYGLGASVWSEDDERAERIARSLACGSAFVNGMVKSDPRLPFGGIKNSGFGRELSRLGIEEFTNAKTLWVA